jgi:ABC-type branched-subunit amino acid transport system substrate-binding protein
MARGRDKAIACFLVLALLATFCSGCTSKTEAESTIRIGYITDVTGQGAPVLIGFTFLLEDLVRYYNEEDLIPGVNIKVITYDTQSDASRYIPAYDYVKEKGAQVIVVCLPDAAEMLEPFAERDKIPLAVMPCTETLIDPPGWAFCFSYPAAYAMKSLLKWISEQPWDYAQGPRKIGLVSWNESYSVDVEKGVREYCQAHPDEFRYVAGLLVPEDVMTWSGEVRKVKGCDYVVIPNVPAAMGTFVREFRASNKEAVLIGTDAVAAAQDYLVKMCSWEDVDGALVTSFTPLWTEQYSLVTLATEILHRYRAAIADEIISSGLGYLGGFHSMYTFFELLRQAVTEAGIQNFDGQAFYNKAINFTVTWEGYPEWGFTPTIRYAVKDTAIYKFMAIVQSMVRVSDWLPVIDSEE